MSIPVDTRELMLIAGSDPAAVLDMERRPRADKATGQMLWDVDVAALGGQDGAEVWKVRVAGEPKGISTGQPLRVEGLTVSSWEIDGTGWPSVRGCWRRRARRQAGSSPRPHRGRLVMSTTMTGVRLPVGADAMELDILSCVRRGVVRLEGGELRCALTREPELLGVLADMEEQGLIACELCFRVTDHGRARIAELVAPAVRRAER